MNLVRSAAAGRNWEGLWVFLGQLRTWESNLSYQFSGADPYLSGEAAYETIVGMQSTGVQAWYARAKNGIRNLY